jgi:aminoglycoside phosphotransferase (APT) family kinase protein
MLDASAVLAGRVVVEAASRSNHVGIVRLDGRPIFVLKRNRVAVDDVDPFAAEAAAYRWLASDPATAMLAPRLLDVVADEVMVLEPIVGAQSFGDAFVASTGRHGALLSALGRRLATLHSARPDPGALSSRVPWIFGVARGVVPDIFASDPEITAMAGEIGASPALRAALDELEGRWAPVAPCHGDVKFDNVVLGTLGSAPPDRGIWLLDWEFAGLGPPAWDLAGVIDGLVVPALISLDVATALRQASRGEPALEAHRSAVGPELAPSRREITLATVARLTQSAVQLCAMRHEAPDMAVAARQVLRGAIELSLQLDATADEIVSYVA